MLLKRFGMVTVGVTAGLLAAAPLASATESGDGGHGSDSGAGQTCTLSGGDSGAASDISGDAGVSNIVSQAPISGSAIGVLDCSNILVDNANGNNVNVSPSLNL